MEKVYVLLGVIFNDQNPIIKVSTDENKLDDLVEECREFNRHAPNVAYFLDKYGDRTREINEYHAARDEYNKNEPIENCLMYYDFEIQIHELY